MNPDLKVIIDYSIKDARDIGKKNFRLQVPVDMKELLFYNRDKVVEYINSLGHAVMTNEPNENAWHGWDIPASRQSQFPDEFRAGRNHFDYQMIQITPTTLVVDVALSEVN